jgi:hypothetical protein
MTILGAGALLGVTWYAYHKAFEIVISNVNKLSQNCIIDFEFLETKWTNRTPIDDLLLSKFSTTSSNEIETFEHGIDTELYLETEYQFPDTVLTVFENARKALEYVDFLVPNKWSDFVNRESILLKERPDILYLSTSDTEIEGNISISDSLFNLSFTYSDSTGTFLDTQARSFSFSVTDSMNTSDSINLETQASLEFPLPSVKDQSFFLADVGETLRDTLKAYFATNINLIASPDSGILQLSSSSFYNEVFTYYPNDGFTGVDQFKYTVSNYRGESDTATVTISVADSIGYYTQAAIGDWTTVNEDGDGEAYTMTLEENGTFFIVTADGRVFDRSNYQWEIFKSNGKYFMGIQGFWHPAFNEFRVVDPSLPNSYLRPGNLSFIWYSDIGEGPKPAIRYTKL